MNATGAEVENDLRRRVFLALVERAEPMTPSEIGDRIGETRQQVAYHLDVLVESGLAVSDGGEYFCQPVFLDGSVHGDLVSAVRSVRPAVEESVYVDDDLHDGDVDAVVVNCIKMLVAMDVLGEGGDGD